MKISKRVREEAARIASIWASTPAGWCPGRWSAAAESLYVAAFREALGKPVGDYTGKYDTEAHEAAAEAEALLRTGWTPK